jgi:hypothetical protein
MTAAVLDRVEVRLGPAVGRGRREVEEETVAVRVECGEEEEEAAELLLLREAAEDEADAESTERREALEG